MGLSLLTSGNDAEILQIAATDGKDEFSIYVKPCYTISPEASAVNKLTFKRGMLFYDGKPITDAVAIDVALKNFIEWLKSRMPCILVAHNCKSFDAKFLVQAAEKNGFMDDLGSNCFWLYRLSSSIQGIASRKEIPQPGKPCTRSSR